MADEHPYALWTLYSGAYKRPFFQEEGVQFINPSYFVSPPDKPERHALTWEEWFYQYIGIQRRSRLVTGSSISRECDYVKASHPKRLLGFLKYNGAAVIQELKSGSEQQLLLMELEVLCEGGIARRMKEAYLPLPALKRTLSRFLPAEEPVPFPFLALDEKLSDDTRASSWEFLTKIGVRKEPNLDFYLDILKYMASSFTDARLVDVSRILDLYKTIHGVCIASNNTNDALAHTR